MYYSDLYDYLFNMWVITMTNKSNQEKTYRGEHISVSFDSSKCSHAGNCIKSLPSVFNLKSRPWIKLDKGDLNDIIQTVNKCPSGALNYKETADELVSAQLIKDGPINLRGKINVKTNFQDSGQNMQRVSLCRCGLSKNKPFCDASHMKKFNDDGTLDHRPASKTKQDAAEEISIICVEDGPLMCQGNVKFIASDAEELTVIDAAICRCGASKRKPFCDGSHNKIAFKTT